MHRRHFLASLGMAAVCGPLISTAQGARKYKAAVIGATGHGDYGHDHDLTFNSRSNIEVVALVDADSAGRAKAAERCHPQRQYSDYKKMLEVEKPDLVCFAARHTDQHYAVGRAVLEAGAHLYMEKPFTQTVAQADDLLAIAQRRQLKIVVPHQIRSAPSVVFLREAVAGGLIGELLQVHAFGKQDQRAGGEDMIVLGSHLFDLMRLFAGDPLWCTARILQKGHEVTKADIRQPTENIGPIVGDDIEAQFAFSNGISGTFTSRGALRETSGFWGLYLVGTKGVVRIMTSIYPRLYLRKQGDWSGATVSEAWQPIPGDPYEQTPPDKRGVIEANRRVTDDWIASIESDREPVCSGRNARNSVEMISAVFQAGLKRERVSFPLTDRDHPLMPTR